MPQAVGRIVLAGVLAVAVVAKLRDPRASAAAMATYGFRSLRSQWAALALVLVVESALALAVALGADAAAYLAAALMLLFAATQVSALMAGKAGAPCACFGARSRVGPRSIVGNLLLAAGFAALPSLPGGSLSTDQWLAVGLGIALLACVGLAIAVLALAREVGMLRLRLGPSSALEVSHEGPELGGRTALIERFETGPRTELALAVFTSEGCRVCKALAPAVDSLRREPALAVETFDERAEPEVWEGLAVPGSPYAIAIAADGTVAAKGTFNNLSQLEGILAAAERRRAGREGAQALGV